MKIYTKTGDKGTTALIGGKRVSKADLRVEAYGTIDELKSYMGLLGDLFDDPAVKSDLETIVITLFAAESLVASADEATAASMPQLADDDVKLLEEKIDEMNEKLEPLKAFVLPGGNVLNSHCNIARAVCRRAERAVIRIPDSQNQERFSAVIKYLNRLSDYLFTLSRYSLKLTKGKEKLWLPDK